MPSSIVTMNHRDRVPAINSFCDGAATMYAEDNPADHTEHIHVLRQAALQAARPQLYQAKGKIRSWMSSFCR
jgi:hypothetical protein